MAYKSLQDPAPSHLWPHLLLLFPGLFTSSLISLLFFDNPSMLLPPGIYSSSSYTQATVFDFKDIDSYLTLLPATPDNKELE